MAEILTDNWHLYLPPPPHPDPHSFILLKKTYPYATQRADIFI